MRRLRLPLLILLVLFGMLAGLPAAEPLKTKNVFLVMTDGLRWEEVFRGAEPELFNQVPGRDKRHREGAARALRREFDGKTVEARRMALLPFFWSTIARQGQAFGNQDKGSVAHVTNGHNFSYPGYSETLCGYADPWVDSNDKRPNRNRTVLEWLGRKPPFRGKIAAFGAWDVFPYIFNRERCGFFINAGYEPMHEGEITPKLEVLNRLKRTLPVKWAGEPFDALTFETAVEYIRLHEPPILFLSLGETDEWAHEGRYDEYLRSARRFDGYLESLWNLIQAHPHYRDHTTLIVTTDHGRGHGPDDWRNHGEKHAGSDKMWIAVLGPDTPPLGERTQIPPVTQSQVAATLAKFAGEDYTASVPRAAKPIADVFR